jgi:hypothetical protein
MRTTQGSKDAWRRELFLQKTARSVTEIQPRLSSVDEVMVFLEVLGYNDRNAVRNGFLDLYDLSKGVFEFTAYYDSRQPLQSAEGLAIKSATRRLAEGLGMSFAWLSSLLLLYTTGVSFWMGWRVPLTAMTSVVVGAFLGIVITEGPIQSFSRLFLLNYNQLNMRGARLAVKRCYYSLLFVLVLALGLIYGVGVATAIPASLVGLAALSTISIAWHRISYMLIYALEKVKILIPSYSAAGAALFITFTLGSGYFPDTLTRYIISMGVSLLVLSVSPIYVYYDVFHRKPKSTEASRELHFYRQPKMSSDTIKANFGVQFWEVLPYYLYGTFFFIMLFSDRVISWFYNPLKDAVGVNLPLLFNSAYHAGADTALLVMFPVMFMQYMLMGPVHAELNNGTNDLRVAEMAKVSKFLVRRYFRLMEATLAVSVPLCAMLIIFAPTFVTGVGGATTSVMILRVASLSNVLVSMFVANVLFLTLLTRARTLVATTFVGAAIVIGLGLYLGSFGFQYAVYAYLAAAAFVTTTSSLYVTRLLAHADEVFFSRFS